MSKLEKKQFVVIGLGRFGTSLTKSLYEAGAEVLAIDSSEELTNDISPFCTQSICADASDQRVLAKLGIHNFDIVIVCIGGDIESSIFVTLICKQLGVKKVIAKAQNEIHKLVLEKIGADQVIFPEGEMGEKLAQMLTKPNMLEILALSETFRIVEIFAPTKWQGKSLLQLDLRRTEKISIILIKRGDEIIVSPGGECVLHADDMIVIAGSFSDTNRVSSKATRVIL